MLMLESHDRHPVVGIDPTQVFEAGRDLLHTESERGGNAEQCADDGDGVDRVADATLDALAPQKRLEQPTYRQRASLAVRHVRQSEADHDVDGPGVQAPVEEGELHRLSCSGVGATGNAARLGWRHVVRERLGDAVEHQADAHACAEQHGEPRHDAELGLLVVATEANVSDLAQAAVQREEHESGGRQDVPPPDTGCDGRIESIERICGGSGVDHREGDHGEDDDRRGNEDGLEQAAPRFFYCFHLLDFLTTRVTVIG